MEISPLEYAGRIAYSSKAVLQFSFDQARKYKDIPNTCIVEAGVAAGAQIIALMAGSECKVPIYAIDSFDGLPLPSNGDDQYPGIRFLSKEEQASLPDPGKQQLVSSGATVVSEGDFWHHIDTVFGPRKHNVKTIKGWFEETLPKFECPPISILRLDGDLYNSTYVCLKHLYPKVIKGGLCIIDDFALPGCRQAFADYLNEMDLDTPLFQSIVDSNSHVIYWTK
jgi:O-methyltransferase